MELEVAIIDANTLSAMGLKQLLCDIIPMVEICVMHSFEELLAGKSDHFIHYFVASNIYFEHTQFFNNQPHRSIVLVHGDAYPHLAGLQTLNVCQSEKALIKSLIHLQHRGHAAHQLSPIPQIGEVTNSSSDSQENSYNIIPHHQSLLTAREAEVAILLAKGHINKEVAEMLNISLTTVISHRKSIMDKLRARSLADIIVYVLVNGLISVEEL